MKSSRRSFISIVLAAGLAANAGWARDASDRHGVPRHSSEERFCKYRLHGEFFSRTELFFGLSRATGPDISEAEFQNFVDAEVTPRFPDGLTLLSGNGQFRDASGTIVQEGSKLLILLYPFSKQNNQAVEAIRTRYKENFQQQSVLRVDEQTCVSF